MKQIPLVTLTLSFPPKKKTLPKVYVSSVTVMKGPAGLQVTMATSSELAQSLERYNVLHAKWFNSFGNRRYY